MTFLTAASCYISSTQQKQLLKIQKDVFFFLIIMQKRHRPHSHTMTVHKNYRSTVPQRYTIWYFSADRHVQASKCVRLPKTESWSLRTNLIKAERGDRIKEDEGPWRRGQRVQTSSLWVKPTELAQWVSLTHKNRTLKVPSKKEWHKTHPALLVIFFQVLFCLIWHLQVKGVFHWWVKTPPASETVRSNMDQ